VTGWSIVRMLSPTKNITDMVSKLLSTSRVRYCWDANVGTVEGADLPRCMTEFAAALNADVRVSSRTVATEWRNHGWFAEQIVTRCVGISSSSRSSVAAAASLRTDLPSCCAAAR
jgi:hypothetical protein